VVVSLRIQLPSPFHQSLAEFGSRAAKTRRDVSEIFPRALPVAQFEIYELLHRLPLRVFIAKNPNRVAVLVLSNPDASNAGTDLGVPVRWLIALAVVVEEDRQRAARRRQSDLAGPAAGIRSGGGGESGGCAVGKGLSAA